MTKNSLEEIALEIKDKTLNFLSLKPRSERETNARVTYYLKKYKWLKDFEKEAITSDTIKDLKRNNLLDDKKFAKAFVKEKINSPKTTSKLKVEQFLKRKGVKDSVINEAMRLFTDELEEQNLQKDAEKKLPSLKEPNIYKKKSKLISYLASRGYPYSKIYTVVDRIVDVK